MLSWEECTQPVSLRRCLDRMGWILGVSMESCHHRQKSTTHGNIFPFMFHIDGVVSLDMLTDFCISHSLESCLALSNFSWSHSHIRSPSQNYLLTWLHLAPSLLSTEGFSMEVWSGTCVLDSSQGTQHTSHCLHTNSRDPGFSFRRKTTGVSHMNTQLIFVHGSSQLFSISLAAKNGKSIVQGSKQ